MKWFENPIKNVTPIFWLNGIAGIGKSTVARTIAEAIDGQKQLGASFFFSRINGIMDPNSLFSTMALQLSSFNQEIRKEIAGVLEKDPDSGRQLLRLQLQKLIIDPLLKLKDPPPRLLLVIDALDECLDDGAKEILQHLLSLTPRVPFLKVLITSRPEHHIESAFEESASHTGVVMHNIEDFIVQQDLKIYLRDCFEVIRKRWPSWWWTEAELDELVRRAGRFFVYISTVKQFVGDPHIGDPRSQLDILLKASSPSDTADYTSSPYHFLDHPYLHVVNNAMPPAKRKHTLARYQTIVGTIIIMVDPIPVESLAQLVGLSIGNLRSALSFLPSVISLPTSDNKEPQIYHPSFPDFITDPDRCEDADLVIIPHDHHRRLATRCLFLMMEHLKRDICGINDSSKLNSEVEGLQERAKRAIPPWLRYALFHWGTHLEQSPQGDSQVKEGLESFCTKSLLYWIEALSVLDRMEVAIPLITRVHTWAVSLWLL